MSEPNGQKLSGSYYTPERLARPISRWVLATGATRVLDPSAGPGSFLRTLMSVAVEERKSTSVFGIDRDPRILNGVWRLRDEGIPDGNLRHANFFDASPEDRGWGAFDAVVGNPPYIRHHNVPQEDHAAASFAIAAHDISLSRRSDMWAYFVLHATNFLDRDGALAFVLPFSSLTADYAKPLIEYLGRRFSDVKLIRLKERFFSDAQEGSAVLACLGWSSGSCTPQYVDVEDAEGLDEALNPTTSDSSAQDDEGWLPDAAQRALHPLVNLDTVPRLGEVAEIKIGVVTGANKYFIRASGDPVAHLANPCTIIVRARELSGLWWTQDDESELTNSNTPSLLMRPSLPLDDLVQQYLESPEGLAIRERSQCRRRTPWYQVRDTERPDALLRYMGSTPGWIVVNKGQATCTNTIHRLFWKSPYRGQSTAVAVGSLTSAFGLSQELQGRAYGGGILKLEPSEAGRCLLPVVPVREVDARRMDKLLRQEDLTAARQLADTIVLGRTLGLSNEQVVEIQELMNRMRERRRSVRPRQTPKDAHA